jgi:hypothetical protein
MKKGSWKPTAALVLAVTASLLSLSAGPAQTAAAKAPAFQAIREIPLPEDLDSVWDMRVKGDGSLVVYVAPLKSNLEPVLMADTTRLKNTLLETAKQARAKNDDPRISIVPDDYAFVMIKQIEISPFNKAVQTAGKFSGVEGGWEWVAYYVDTRNAGPFILINELKAPEFRPISFAVGVFPSFLSLPPANKEIAYWARPGTKFVMMVGQQQMITLEEGLQPRGPALVFRGAPVNTVYVAGSEAKGTALYFNLQKLTGEFGSIEPALNVLGPSAGYIAKTGNTSKLFLNGVEVTTGFVPGHGLTYYAGGGACAFAAVQDGRQFVVKSSLKAPTTFVRAAKERDFGHVIDLAFDSLAAKVAYVAEDKNKEWIMVDDQPVTPEFDRVAYNLESYQWGGPLVFAGYDAARRVIVVGKI